MNKKLLFIFYFVFSFNPAFGKTASEINSIIRQMTDEEKAAALLIVRTYSSESIDDILKVFFPGGFIHHGDYDRGGYLERMNEIARLQKLSVKRTKFKSLFMVDQEGCQVSRFSSKFKEREGGHEKHFEMAGPRRLSAVGSLRQTQKLAGQLGSFLRAFGFNMNLAPVVDVFRSDQKDAYIGGRSFGSDPLQVRDMSRAFTLGLQKEGVSAVFKHFPGYSSTSKNSHKELVVIDVAKKDLINTDWIPYQFQKGLSTPQAVMSNIALYPKLDARSTATLSKTIITDFLKTELNYKGLIITDDIGMKGYKEPNLAQRAVRSLRAGHDMVLMTMLSNKQVIRVYKGLAKAVKNGDLSLKKVNESLKKIFQLKTSLAVDQRPILERLKSVQTAKKALYQTNLRIIDTIIDNYFKKNPSLKNSLSMNTNLISFHKESHPFIERLKYFKNHKKISKKSLKNFKLLEKENSVGFCYGGAVGACVEHSSPAQKKNMIVIDTGCKPLSVNRKLYRAYIPVYGHSPRAADTVLQTMIQR